MSLPGIQCVYYLGVFEWMQWTFERARDTVDFYDEVGESVAEYKEMMYSDWS